MYGKIKDYEDKYSMFGNFQISLNWIDYLKGTKLIDEEEIFITFNKNFYVAFLDNNNSALFATFITENDKP
jgi:hypothetical protein